MSCERHEMSIVLSGAATSPGEARRFVDETLASWSLSALRDEVELLTSELVTNVVLHARTEFTVRLRRLHGSLRVEVVDGSLASPRKAHVIDDDVEGATGRGLLLVEALAVNWGVAPTHAGKTVWFEVAA
jgi:anti-sigma regulatory factor (Ser/Thr protein kinase)